MNTEMTMSFKVLGVEQATGDIRRMVQALEQMATTYDSLLKKMQQSYNSAIGSMRTTGGASPLAPGGVAGAAGTTAVTGSLDGQLMRLNQELMSLPSKMEQAVTKAVVTALRPHSSSGSLVSGSIATQTSDAAADLNMTAARALQEAAVSLKTGTAQLEKVVLASRMGIAPGMEERFGGTLKRVVEEMGRAGMGTRVPIKTGMGGPSSEQIMYNQLATQGFASGGYMLDDPRYANVAQAVARMNYQNPANLPNRSVYNRVANVGLSGGSEQEMLGAFGQESGRGGSPFALAGPAQWVRYGGHNMHMSSNIFQTGLFGMGTALGFGALSMLGGNIHDVLNYQYQQASLNQIQGGGSRGLDNMVNSAASKYNVMPVEAYDVAFKMKGTYGDTNEAMKATNATLLLSRTSAIQLTQAMNDLVAITDSYQTGAKGMGDVVNGLVGIQNNFGVSTEQMVQSMARTGELMHSLGFDAPHAAALLAVGTRVTGMSGEGLSSYFERVLPQFLDPTAQQAIASIGVKNRIGISEKDFLTGTPNVQSILGKLSYAYNTGQLSKQDLQTLAVTVGKTRNTAQFEGMLKEFAGPGSLGEKATAAYMTGEATGAADQRWKQLQGTALMTLKGLESGVSQLTQQLAQAGILQEFGLLAKVLTVVAHAVTDVVGVFNTLLSGLGPLGTGLKIAGAGYLTTLGLQAGLRQHGGIGGMLHRGGSAGRASEDLLVGLGPTWLAAEGGAEISPYAQMAALSTQLKTSRASYLADLRMPGSSTYAMGGGLAAETQASSELARLGEETKLSMLASMTSTRGGVAGEAGTLFKALKIGVTESITAFKELTLSTLALNAAESKGVLARGFGGIFKTGSSELSSAEGFSNLNYGQRMVAQKLYRQGIIDAGASAGEAGVSGAIAGSAVGAANEVGLATSFATAIGSVLPPMIGAFLVAYGGYKLTSGITDAFGYNSIISAQHASDVTALSAAHGATAFGGALQTAADAANASWSKQGIVSQYTNKLFGLGGNETGLTYGDLEANPELMKNKAALQAVFGKIPDLAPGQVFPSDWKNQRISTSDAQNLAKTLKLQAVTNINKEFSDLSHNSGLLPPELINFREQDLLSSLQYGTSTVDLYGGSTSLDSSGNIIGGAGSKAGKKTTSAQYIKQLGEDITNVQKEIAIALQNNDTTLVQTLEQQKNQIVATRADFIVQSTQATDAYKAFFASAADAAALTVQGIEEWFTQHPGATGPEAMQQKLALAQAQLAQSQAPYDVGITAAQNLSSIVPNIPHAQVALLQQQANLAISRAQTTLAMIGNPNNSIVQQAMTQAVTATSQALEAYNQAQLTAIEATGKLQESETRNPVTRARIELQTARSVYAQTVANTARERALGEGTTGNPVVDQFIKDLKDQADLQTSQQSDASQKLGKASDNLDRVGNAWSAIGKIWSAVGTDILNALNGGGGGSGPTQPWGSGTNGPDSLNKLARTQGSIKTPTDFAKALLQGIGAPVTSSNVNALVAWEHAEGGNWLNSAKYNPLNTTQHMNGSTSMNSKGVQAFTSWGQGLEATIKTLENGLYGPILNTLKSGHSASAVLQAIVNSPWSSYPNGISLNGQSYGKYSAAFSKGAPGGQTPAEKNALAAENDALYQVAQAQVAQLQAVLQYKAGPVSNAQQLKAEMEGLRAKVKTDKTFGDLTSYYTDLHQLSVDAYTLAQERVSAFYETLQLNTDTSNQAVALEDQLKDVERQMKVYLAHGGLKTDSAYTALQVQARNAKRDQALAVTQNALHDEDYAFAMHKEGWEQHIQNLIKLKNTINTKTRAGLELWQQINQEIQGMIDSLAGQFNLPDIGKLMPSVYEARRVAQGGAVGAVIPQNQPVPYNPSQFTASTNTLTHSLNNLNSNIGKMATMHKNTKTNVVININGADMHMIKAELKKWLGPNAMGRYGSMARK